MRTDADRAEKYTAKYVAATVGLKVASRLGTMKTGYAAGITSIVADELQIQGILNSSGVMGISRAGYYNFGRELSGKIFRGSAGDGLKADAVAIATKWTSFGFDNGIIKDIALIVYGITIP